MRKEAARASPGFIKVLFGAEASSRTSSANVVKYQVRGRADSVEARSKEE